MVASEPMTADDRRAHNGHGNESDHRNRAGLQIRQLKLFADQRTEWENHQAGRADADYATDQTDDADSFRMMAFNMPRVAPMMRRDANSRLRSFTDEANTASSTITPITQITATKILR